MIKYYTRACNFYYGLDSIEKIKKKLSLPLNGNKLISFDNIEIIKNPPSRSAKLRYATRNKNEFIYPSELSNKFKKYLDLEKSHA